MMQDDAVKDRWARIGPLLSELLGRGGVDRAQRIAELRLSEPALADDVEALLRTFSGVEGGVTDAQPARGVPRNEPSLGGRVVGAYTIERELGQGGMGSVWLARRSDGRFDGHVAIKFLNTALASRWDRERFAREGSILARLAHPHIARLLDAGVAPDGGQPYLVLEYIDGVPIKQHCDENALDLDARLRLFLDVLSAVEHAHNRLILHRDLKPSNILVTAAGEVKLLDFGIAKLLDDTAGPTAVSELTQAAGRAYTLQYAAPEQLRAGDVSTATDVYALGVLLYVLLGGVHPTAGGTTTPLDQMRAVIETEPRRLSDAVLRNVEAGPAAAKLRLARALRGDLDNIVAKALKKQPAERYANAGLLAEDLRRHLAHEPVSARRDAVGYVLAKFVRRHRLGVAASAVVVASLAAGIGVAIWEAREAQRQRVQAEGLIEFMLGDLRKKLQPVGRLDVLDAVGAKALDYYAVQNAGRLDADSLGRRARALHLIGEITERRGSLDDATRVFQRAADSTAELMARAPGDAQRVFDHAQSMYWVGYMARRRGRVAEAETAFREYQALAQQLTRLDPDKLDWRIETTYAGVNLGVFYLENSRPALALDAFNAAQHAWAEIVVARPDLGINLARTWGWIAKAREALGQFDEAALAQRTKIDVLRRLPDVDRNRDAQQLLANASYELGRLGLARGRFAEAAQATRDALPRIDALVAADAANTEWLAQMVFARVSLAEILAANGDAAAARDTLESTQAAMTRLLASDGKRNKWNITLAGSVLLQRVALGDARATLRDDLQALSTRVTQAVARGDALDPEQLRIACAADLALGDLLAGDALPVQAGAHWRAAAARLQAPAAAGDLPAITLLAQAQLRLGATPQARALAARIEASPYRHPAFADLRQRLAAAAGAAPAKP